MNSRISDFLRKSLQRPARMEVGRARKGNYGGSLQKEIEISVYYGWGWSYGSVPYTKSCALERLGTKRTNHTFTEITPYVAIAGQVPRAGLISFERVLKNVSLQQVN